MSIKIQIDHPKEYYHPGNVLTGRIVCNVENTALIEVWIKLVGEECIYTTDKGSALNRKCIFFKSKDNTLHSGILDKGAYEFRFTLTLPWGIPSTYEGENGYVKYFLRGYMHIEKTKAFEDELDFKVFSRIDLNDYTVSMEPVLNSDNYVSEDQFWCIPKMIEMEVKLNKDAYVVGETVNAVVALKNNTHLAIKNVTVALCLCIVASTTNKRFKVNQVIATGTRQNIKERNYKEMFLLEIPENAKIPNFDKCSLFTQKGLLRATARMANSKEVEVTFEVILGHIPVHGKHVRRRRAAAPSPVLEPLPYSINSGLPTASSKKLSSEIIREDNKPSYPVQESSLPHVPSRDIVDPPYPIGDPLHMPTLPTPESAPRPPLRTSSRGRSDTSHKVTYPEKDAFDSPSRISAPYPTDETPYPKGVAPYPTNEIPYLKENGAPLNIPSYPSAAKSMSNTSYFSAYPKSSSMEEVSRPFGTNLPYPTDVSRNASLRELSSQPLPYPKFDNLPYPKNNYMPMPKPKDVNLPYPSGEPLQVPSLPYRSSYTNSGSSSVDHESDPPYPKIDGSNIANMAPYPPENKHLSRQKRDLPYPTVEDSVHPSGWLNTAPYPPENFSHSTLGFSTMVPMPMPMLGGIPKKDSIGFCVGELDDPAASKRSTVHVEEPDLQPSAPSIDDFQPAPIIRIDEISSGIKDSLENLRLGVGGGSTSAVANVASDGGPLTDARHSAVDDSVSDAPSSAVGDSNPVVQPSEMSDLAVGDSNPVVQPSEMSDLAVGDSNPVVQPSEMSDLAVGDSNPVVQPSEVSDLTSTLSNLPNPPVDEIEGRTSAIEVSPQSVLPPSYEEATSSNKSKHKTKRQAMTAS